MMHMMSARRFLPSGPSAPQCLKLQSSQSSQIPTDWFASFRVLSGVSAVSSLAVALSGAQTLPRHLLISFASGEL